MKNIKEMKAQEIIIMSVLSAVAIWLVFMFTYKSPERKAYDIKRWEHESRMLDIKYEREVKSLKSTLEIELTIRRLDSIINTRKN